MGTMRPAWMAPASAISAARSKTHFKSAPAEAFGRAGERVLVEIARSACPWPGGG